MPRPSADKAFDEPEDLARAAIRVPGTLPHDDLEAAFQMVLDEIRKRQDTEAKFADLLAASR